MKVKIFANKSVTDLENEANEFLKTVSNVVDIKYSSSESFSELLILYND